MNFFTDPKSNTLWTFWVHMYYLSTLGWHCYTSGLSCGHSTKSCQLIFFLAIFPTAHLKRVRKYYPSSWFMVSPLSLILIPWPTFCTSLVLCPALPNDWCWQVKKILSLLLVHGVPSFIILIPWPTFCTSLVLCPVLPNDWCWSYNIIIPMLTKSTRVFKTSTIIVAKKFPTRFLPILMNLFKHFAFNWFLACWLPSSSWCLLSSLSWFCVQSCHIFTHI